MSNSKKTFEEWKQEFETLLFKKFLITVDDCTNEEQLRREYNDGSSVEEFVNWIGEKYELTPSE